MTAGITGRARRAAGRRDRPPRASAPRWVNPLAVLALLGCATACAHAERAREADRVLALQAQAQAQARATAELADVTRLTAAARRGADNGADSSDLLDPERAGGGLRAFVGARVLPIAGPEIADGVLVVDGGRIVAVGARGDTPIPDGASVRDVSGLLIMPGLVDTHSHVGEPWAGDSSEPMQPDVRVYDAIDVRHASIQRAQAGGVTVANIMPGSGHLMSGQTTYVKLRDVDTIDELVARDADGAPMGGMKMANGTNSQDDPPFPGTRGKSAAIVRSRFVAAQEYRRKRDAADAGKGPDRDLANEALLEVLDGKRVVHHHTHRHDDIVTVLRLQQEFGFRLVLQHVSEAYKVVDELVAAGSPPCSLIVIDSPGGKLEAVDMAWETGGVLEQAGIPVAFHTDDAVNDSRLFLRSAALAVRGGMSREGALAAVTLTAAAMLDMQDRVGSLEAGKDADFVLMSGDPLSTYAQVLETWVDGRKVFDRDDPGDRLYAEGGYGASEPRRYAGLCCFGPGGAR